MSFIQVSSGSKDRLIGQRLVGIAGVNEKEQRQLLVERTWQLEPPPTPGPGPVPDMKYECWDKGGLKVSVKER